MNPKKSGKYRKHPSVPVLLGVLGLLAVFSAAARSATLDATKIHETVFPSGLRLIVKEAHATPLAAVQVWVRAGGFLEDETTSGTAHAIEHLVFKGEGGGSSGEGSVDAAVEELGGVVEADTEKDWTRFGCTLAGVHAGRALTAIADALRRPRFDPKDWDAERPVMLREIEEAHANPVTVMVMGLFDMAFEKHPYRRDVRGTPKTINPLDLRAVREYYQRYYTPANMVVVVIGDVDTPAMERACRAAFQADQPAAKETPVKLPADEKACAKPRRTIVPTGFANGYVGIAYPAPSVKDVPDVYAMDLLLMILENGPTGRLPRLLRDQAGVDVTFETRRQPGLLTIAATTNSPGVEQVETLIRKEIDFLASRPVPEEELQYAKRALHGSYALENETYSGQASTLGYYAMIDRWQFAADYLEKVNGVTAAQLQETARKYLSPEHSVAALLKPQAGRRNDQ